MTQNPYLKYYSQQSGGALPGFKGVHWQRGHGFFGRLASWVMPFIKEIFPIVGKQAMSTGIDIAKDTLKRNDVRDSAKKRFKEAGILLLDLASERLQKGQGIKKRRRRGRNLMTQKKNIRKKPIKRIKRRKKKKKKRRKRKRSKKSFDFF